MLIFVLDVIIATPVIHLSVDEAEVLAGRFKSVSGRYYVLHDPEKLTDKYIAAWNNFGISVRDIGT